MRTLNDDEVTAGYRSLQVTTVCRKLEEPADHDKMTQAELVNYSSRSPVAADY